VKNTVDESIQLIISEAEEIISGNRIIRRCSSS